MDKGKEWIENLECKQRNVNMAISLTGNWANCIAATFQLIFMLVIGLMILYGHLNMIYMMPIVNVSNNFIVNFPQYLYIYTNKHPVVLSQRVFFMIHLMLVLFY